MALVSFTSGKRPLLHVALSFIESNLGERSVTFSGIFGVDNISSVTDRLGSFSPLKKDIDWLDFVEWDSVTSGQSYKGSMIVNYDSRIIIWAIF